MHYHILTNKNKPVVLAFLEVLVTLADPEYPETNIQTIEHISRNSQRQ